jgi:hypothetical protein
MDMNIAATKTTPTATFWLIRGVTGSLSSRLRPGCGAVSWYLPAWLQDHAGSENSGCPRR